MVTKKDMEKEEEIEQEQTGEEITEEGEIEDTEQDEASDAEVSQSERETQLRDQLIRLQADFTNYKRRSENERKEYLDLGIQKVVLDMLVVVDNFERALSQVNEKDSFSEGVELIYSQLKDLLNKYEVKEINETNIKFDPNMHHAVLVEEREGVEDGIVIDILQKGYKMKEKILRPAMVKVSQ